MNEEREGHAGHASHAGVDDQLDLWRRSRSVEGGSSAEPIFSAGQIAERVTEMGEQITLDYSGLDLVVLGVLKGSFIFMADLVRSISLPLEVEFMELSSYGAALQSSGVVEIVRDLSIPVSGRHLLIVEDIVDSGLTLNYLLRTLQLKRPASIEIAALLYKKEKMQLNYPIRYPGFAIEDHFVVGYGLDHAGHYRNLDHIALLTRPPAVTPDGAPGASP